MWAVMNRQERIGAALECSARSPSKRSVVDHQHPAYFLRPGDHLREQLLQTLELLEYSLPIRSRPSGAVQCVTDTHQLFALDAEVLLYFFKGLYPGSCRIHDRAGRCRLDLLLELVHHPGGDSRNGIASPAKVAFQDC
jgi:hypothetical protein